MSRSMPVTAGTPSKDLTSSTSRISPPDLLPGSLRSCPPVTRTRSVRHRFGEPGEVGREPVDVVAVVLYGQQPLLHLPPWREEYPAIVLHEPVQVAQSGVDPEEVAELAHPVPTERHTTLGAHRDDVPVVPVFGDHALQRGTKAGRIGV